MIAMMLMLVADDATLLAAARRRTTAETHCVFDPASTDITVCGLRNADRFRVPFAGNSDARFDGVPAERERMLNRSNPVKDLSPFLVGGGMAGVSVSTRTGVGGLQQRKPAP